jgi:hypothetical protein
LVKHSKYSAQELAVQLQNGQFEEWIEPNEFSPNHRSMITENQVQSSVVSGNNTMVIYPNPAGDQATVLINLPDDESEGKLEVYDITGKHVGEFVVRGDGKLDLNTSDYSRGVYVCSLVVDGQAIDKVKLVVIK